MATTKIWSVRHNAGWLLEYCANPQKTDATLWEKIETVEATLGYAADQDKTEQCMFVSGINCSPETAAQEFQLTKIQHGKPGGVLVYHAVQSFVAGEVTPEQAHEIGTKLAQQMWGDRFEVQVATHLNTENIHNHFVLNSVSFADGGKYNDCKTTYRQLRGLSDKLCQEYNLSVAEQSKGKGKHYAEWKAEQDGKPTWRSLIRADVDLAIAESLTFVHFIKALERRGYEVDTSRKHMRIKPPAEMKEKTDGKYDGYFRVYTLSEEYSEDAIKRRILDQRSAKPPPKSVPARAVYLKGKHGNVKKLSGFRALYFHYLYKMGILPNPKTPRRASFLYRQDLIKLDRISAEVRLLCQNKIDTADQLRDFRAGKEQDVAQLCDQRRKMYNRLRRCPESEKEELKQQIAALSPKIKTLRKEVLLCEKIEERSLIMKNRIAAERQDTAAKRKELNQPERRSRSNR